MTPYLLSNGHQGDAQAKINDLQQMNEQLERELTAWETELSKVMPPDYKDWWQNDKREWPLVARLVIEGKNRHAELDAAAYEKLERELAAERALADRLGNWMQEHRKAWQWQNVDPDCDCEDCVFLVPFDEALAAWKEARHGTV